MKAIAQIIILTLCFNSLIAQPPPPWVLPGNTVGTTGNFLGTVDAFPMEIKTTSTSGGGQPINFYTNGSTNIDMQIDATGNVGIGITVPIFKLDVDGGDINLNQTPAGASLA